MTINTFLNLVGLASGLAGFFYLVIEVGYSHLTEFHTLNQERALNKATKFRSGPFWEDLPDEDKAAYENQISKDEKYFKENWQNKVQFRSLEVRMGCLRKGIILVIVGTILQAIATII